jgi:tetratricopeptide (TPR) repeat protein
MTQLGSQSQTSDTFYEKLLSCALNPDQMENIRKSYPEIRVREKQEECIKFCKEVSREWILRTHLHSDDGTSNEDKTKILNEAKDRIIALRNDCRESDEYDAQIYSYFLYFCGILFHLSKKEDEEDRNELRKFLNLRIQHTTNSNRRLLLRFLTTYIDLVDPEIQDIIVFEDLKECLATDDDNVIFGAIEKEHDLIVQILNETPRRNRFRSDRIAQVFPIEAKQIAESGENSKSAPTQLQIIESIIDSGMARLYYIAGRETEHIDKLQKALEKSEAFPNNSFALLQTAHLILKNSDDLEKEKALGREKALLIEELIGKLDKEKALLIEDERLVKLFDLVKTVKDTHSEVKKTNKGNYLDISEYLFKKVIKLIDNDDQFKGFEPFNYRIKFEGVLGLAYIYYKKNQYNEAEKKYLEAEKIIHEHLYHNKEYLTAVTQINSGRNKYDNGPNIRSRRDAKNEFESVVRIYERAIPEIKEELAEIAARAHNNLGIYYLDDADYEKAEQQFRKAIEVDDTNAHARYNLGVLYHIKDDDIRAKKLFQNAHSLGSRFSEAGEGLERLGAMNKGGLVSQWYNWWFASKKGTKGTIRKRGKQIIAVALILVMISAFGTLAFELYQQGYEYLRSLSSGNPVQQLPDVDEGAFIIILTISIVFLMLPFISKLKISDIEIDLETAGYQAIGPASVGAGFQEKYQRSIRFEFFFAHFWY